ncbi:hypothetical protein C0993_008619 [Termitomyces sp. T159_Od127]|nr:hypothetical protein C0993_008619 [Termitomyces sp. T159_Od127]
MLNSWFASEDDIASHNPKGSFKVTDITPTGFASPHDAVLARMRGQPHVEPTHDGLLREEVPTLRKEEQSTIPDTTHPTPQDPIAEKARAVYDPFEGTPIGLLMTAPGPADRMQQAESTNPSGPSSSRIGDHERKLEQWEHLSRVLDLQNELARMHLEMEGVGILLLF